MILLTNEEENFCKEFVAGTPQLIAYRNHFPKTKKDSANCGLLLKKRHICARITELRDAAARVSIMDGAKVIKEWTAIALGDVNDLVQYQRVNCRHCHGVDGKYQWKDEEEFAHANAVAIDAMGSKAALASKLGMPPPKLELPTDDGGYGFQFNLDPNDSCLNCFGEGLERLFIPDTRTLSEDAKRLYAGVKQTANGIEIKTRDQDAALVNLAKYFKVLGNDEKSDTTVTINVKGGLPE